jgi:hypothetical protein
MQHGRQPIPPVDLLALSVGATGVGDGHLLDTAAEFGDLDGDLGFEPKAIG